MIGTIFAPSEAEKKYFSISKYIYHYTSPEGVIGILENKNIWFSRFDCLNDVSEGTYIRKIYEKVIQIIRDNHSIESDFIDEICDIEPSLKHFFRMLSEDSNELDKKITMSEGSMKSAKPYLCCFSRRKDALPMWNYYTKGNRYEGYNIGFDYKKTLEKYESIDVIRVIYNEDDQIAILQNLVMNAYENYKKNEHSIKSCRNFIASQLASRSMQFKNSAFSHEQEVRLVKWIPDDNSIGSGDNNIKFRQKNGIIIPYIIVPFDNDQVKSIKVGPLIQTEIAERTMKDMLTEKGYSKVNVSHSDVPIRY